ncbi:MAG: riboflavin synthase [Marinirhabdus sp.]
MFTGIIEDIGTVTKLQPNGGNLYIEIESKITPGLSIDQSVAHNGVCLTVVAVNEKSYGVTAIRETLEKSNLSEIVPASKINLERARKIGDFLDGHIVQGHVDQTATCTSITEENGSWLFTFSYDLNLNNITVEKGSVTVNGVSLTVVNSKMATFSVAIIPYTYKNTNFNTFKVGTIVNVEFDIVGKYVKRLTEGYF